MFVWTPLSQSLHKPGLSNCITIKLSIARKYNLHYNLSTPALIERNIQYNIYNFKPTSISSQYLNSICNCDKNSSKWSTAALQLYLPPWQQPWWLCQHLPPAPGSVCQVQCPKIIFAHKLCPLFNYFKLRARILFATFCRIRSRILRLRCSTPTHTWATVTTVVHSMRGRRWRGGGGCVSSLREMHCDSFWPAVKLPKKGNRRRRKQKRAGDSATDRQTERQTSLGPGIDTCTTVVAGEGLGEGSLNIFATFICSQFAFCPAVEAAVAVVAVVASAPRCRCG